HPNFAADPIRCYFVGGDILLICAVDNVSSSPAPFHLPRIQIHDQVCHGCAALSIALERHWHGRYTRSYSQDARARSDCNAVHTETIIHDVCVGLWAARYITPSGQRVMEISLPLSKYKDRPSW